MEGVMTIGEVVRSIAERRGIEVPPTKLSNLFYQRKLSSVRCPVVCGVRRIPADYLPWIEAVLEERGVLPESGVHRAS